MPLYIKSTLRTVRRVVGTDAPAAAQTLRRDLQRRRVRLEVSRPAVFYHIACLGNWEDVVAEQLDLLAHVGLSGRVDGAILGTPVQIRRCLDLAQQRGMTLGAHFSDIDMNRYEAPTLDAMQNWARAHRRSAALYFHTKGVSEPSDAGRTAWRHLMQRHVIERWRQNLQMLQAADAVGVGWYDDHPHFSGNFWLARADWLASLPPIHRYQQEHTNLRILDQPWDRMACERWIGARPGIRVVSLACRNKQLWLDSVASELLQNAPPTPVARALQQ
jgi:hypothetical protein